MDSYFRNISIGIAALSVAYYFINQSGVGTYQISAPLQLNTKTGELYILSGGVSKKKIMDATFGKPASSLQDVLNSKDTATKVVDWSQFSDTPPKSKEKVDWSQFSDTPPAKVVQTISKQSNKKSGSIDISDLDSFMSSHKNYK